MLPTWCDPHWAFCVGHYIQPDLLRLPVNGSGESGDDALETAVRVRHLHREINSLETDYHAIVRQLVRSSPQRSPLLIAFKVHTLHKRSENILVQLLNFFRISIDSAQRNGNASHRYHAAILEAFPDNLLQGMLDSGQAQDILWSWNRWRHKWVKREAEAELEASEDMKMVGVELPVLLERLREAVSVANGIARRGEQVVRVM
ncbi:hypothetical protein MMC08_006546 [Hypocenomyce scalaris]|nr:hypothetical protein [Hypocenomyce scalaris]